MHHWQVQLGQQVQYNNSEATTIGTVLDVMDRKHTKTGRARYRYRVKWSTGKIEWLNAGELKVPTL